MNIAVIPARGGSKRIPKKNIKPFYGKPIIYWPIKKAIKSNLFDKIIVSTDDNQIRDLAKEYGAEVPFVRPKAISDDYTATSDVIVHAIEFFKKKSYEIDNVCCLYPTSVFFSKDDLASGFKALKKKKWKFSLSVTKYNYPIARSFELIKDGGLKMIYPENFSKRTQDFKTLYHDAAQFYWGKKSAWLEKSQLFGQSSFPIKIPSWKIQDIDEIEDWKRAELLFRLIDNNS
jgi:pseudaminic acid cytidylyltransferase